MTVHGKILGLAHSDADVISFLRSAGLPVAGTLLDDPAQVQWRGGRAHRYDTAQNPAEPPTRPPDKRDHCYP
ncbi:hypothetical protein GCM10010277_86070 [Streptomyces longisporoflavus]|nr:hypothetical protein GCM10010277_86070 [Streptomyces longisporoflavus]